MSEESKERFYFAEIHIIIVRIDTLYVDILFKLYLF